eukprot:g22861.t1
MSIQVRVEKKQVSGWIRFLGTTKFAEGDWVGVELEEPRGKNDGSVKDQRYFTCEEAHGLFVRPANVDYRDWLFLLKINDFICELQVNFKKAVEVKQDVQHDVYEKERLGTRKLLEATMMNDENMVRILLQSAFSDLGPTWAPMEQLQATFDEVLLRPWRFPPHVQELHRMAVLERQQRQRVVDQAPVAAERQALLARKVVYCIMGREPRERSLHELQRAAAAAQSGKLPKRRSNAAKSGLALEHPENLLLYETTSAHSSSLMELLQRDYELAWIGCNVNFILGLMAFASCLVSFSCVTWGAVSRPIACTVLATECLIISIVNDGVVQGDGRAGGVRFGCNLFSLCKRYIVLLAYHAWHGQRLTLALSFCFVILAIHSLLVNITFVNDLKAVDCSLLWHGPIDSGPRADFGPVPAQGGQKVLEEPLLQFDITSDVHHYSINESIAVGRPVPDPDSAEPSSCAADCRSAASCDQCVQLTGCGWSVVRQQCFPGHPFATENSECPETKSGTLQTWLEEAATLMDPEASGFGSASLRAAYRALQHANLQASSEGADPVVPTMDVPSSVFMAELAAKLDAVFDDADATELLAKYLKRFMHRGFYNVAADFKSVCCQYYEPRNISAQAGYPYPFNPRTHLYRDRFSGFVDTLRAKRTSDQKEPMLHYFHDVVMERDGKPVEPRPNTNVVRKESDMGTLCLWCVDSHSAL